MAQGAAPLGRAARLPLMLCGLVLCAPLLLSICLVALRAAGVSGPVYTSLQRWQTPDLLGMQALGPTPTLSGPALLSGAWQKQVELWWNTRMPLRGIIVRSTNQAYYSLLNHSLMLDGKIVFGRDHHLYYLVHLQAHCNWTPEPPARLNSRMEQWARDLKQVQDHFTSRGKIFVYILAPTKPPGASASLPAGFACPGPTEPTRKTLLRFIAGSGLRYVDATAILQLAASRYPDDLLFPRGEYHWTELGATLVLREALAQAGTSAGSPTLLRLPEFSYRMAAARGTADEAYGDLLNLWWRAGPEPLSPRVEFAGGAREGAAQRLRLALVGDSFLNHPAAILARSGLFTRIDHFYYFAGEHRQYVDGVMTMPPNANQPAESYQALAEADVVILEENQLAIGSPYITLLRNHLGLGAQAK